MTEGRGKTIPLMTIFADDFPSYVYYIAQRNCDPPARFQFDLARLSEGRAGGGGAAGAHAAAAGTAAGVPR
jgi:hypothetical protein